MRQLLTLFFAGAFALALFTTATLTSTPVSAAPIAGAPTTYCGDPDTDPSMDTGAGTMITCETSVENTITGFDPQTGEAVGTAVVRVTECTGPANGRLDPSDLTCNTDEANLTNLVTRVDQCNEVGYGGGNVLECSVEITNEFAGVTPEAIEAATVNQCNNSASPHKTGCNPYPATTTNATITQCNNSGGPGQEDFNCLATDSTTTASLSVTVNQCNNSGYGGGSWMNCSTSMTNTATGGGGTPAPTASPAPSTPTPGTSAPTPGPDATTPPTAAPTATLPIGPDGPLAAPSFAPPSTTTLFPGLPRVPDTSMEELTAARTNLYFLLAGLAGITGLGALTLSRRRVD